MTADAPSCPTTIHQTCVPSVTYWHLETSKHDVVFAEGLPCESYLNTDGYEQFDNRSSAPASGHLVEPCARIVTQGLRLEGARQKLHAIAEQLGQDDEPFLHQRPRLLVDA